MTENKKTENRQQKYRRQKYKENPEIEKERKIQRAKGQRDG